MIRNETNQIIFTSGELERLEIVSELDIMGCVSDDTESPIWVNYEIPYGLECENTHLKMRFKTIKLRVIRNRLKLTVFVNGRLELLQIVLELDTE